MVTFNTPELVKETIPDLIQHTDYPHFHLTVVDNASFDGTWDEVQETCIAYHGRVNAYQTHLNRGYGAGCNIGAKLSTPDYYCFLNSDIHTHEDYKDWLTTLITRIESDDEIGVIAPKLLNPAGLVNAHAVLGTNLDNDLSWYWLKPDGPIFDDELEAVTLCGACIIIKRELFWEMGGFDERFFHYYEEKDLIYKLREEGYKAVCNPEAVLIHDHMGSCQDQNLLSVHEFNGRALFQRKHKEFLTDPTVYTR
jgi:GT2 family glycosyltransferase